MTSKKLFEIGGYIAAAVLIDELQGRFCLDCPTRLNPKAPPATVRMSAHWEIYSSLDRKVRGAGFELLQAFC